MLRRTCRSCTAPPWWVPWQPGHAGGVDMRRLAAAVVGASCAALALPGPAPAQDAPPPGEVPALHAIGTAPSAERIEADIRNLVSFGTRHTLSDTESD